MINPLQRPNPRSLQGICVIIPVSEIPDPLKTPKWVKAKKIDKFGFMGEETGTQKLFCKKVSGLQKTSKRNIHNLVLSRGDVVSL